MEKQKKKNSSGKSVYFYSTLIFIAVLIILFAAYILEGMPSLEELENPKPILASKVFSTDGELLGQFFIENRIEISLDSVPDNLIKALIATEDRKFYDHWGVDVDRFFKAMIKNVLSLSMREGASTITQQLARNLYKLKAGKESKFETFIRKIREWITAIQIEKTYTKDEILTMYLNDSFFGKTAYGVETAANIYFNKKAKELTIPESAVLVGLLKSHVIYDPIRRPENALRRRNLVMRNMMEVGFITSAEYNKLKETPIVIAQEKIKNTAGIAPHFVEYVRQQMSALSERLDYDLYRDGLNIYTTLDARMQRIANNAVKEHLEEHQKIFDRNWNWKTKIPLLNNIIDRAIKDNSTYKSAADETEKTKIYNRLKNNERFVDSIKKVTQALQAGFVVLNPKNGAILAMVGGKDLNFAYGLNHTTQIKRQAGSSFKPFIYMAAIENGLYPAFPILNQQFSLPDGWEPKNYDETVSGWTTLRDGLRKSLNLVTARLITENYAPLPKIGEIARKLGIESKLDLFPSISLGTSAVTPLELTNAYSTIANKGVYSKPISILKIEDKNGIILANFKPEQREAISEETAYIITDMMQSVVDYGTGAGVRSRFNFRRPAAGKTGTTQEYADAWFIAFTPQLVGGVWIGFDDHRIKFTGGYGTGAIAAMPIWAKFFVNVYKELEDELPLQYFNKPSGISYATFCSESIFLGRPRLATENCPATMTDIVNVKNMPPYCTTRKEEHFFSYGE